jgi:hypothetical protein
MSDVRRSAERNVAIRAPRAGICYLMGTRRRGWELAIKGPGHRNKFDVRRVWECPACNRRVLTGGHVVNLRCDCRPANGAAPAVWMKLVEGPPCKGVGNRE